MRYFIIIIFLLVLAAQLTLSWQLFKALREKFKNLRYWTILLPAIILAIVAVYGFIPGSSAPRIVAAFADYYLAFLAYAFMLHLLRDLILLMIRLFRRAKSSPRLRALSTWAVLVLACLIVIYGTWHAQSIVLKHYDLELKDTKLAEPLKVALFSDLHLGEQYGSQRVKEIVTMINAEKVDLVFIAGDFFNDNYQTLDNPEAISAELRRLESRYGTYMVWGNHDSGQTFTQMKELVERSGIVLLEDESVEIANLVTLVGRRDSRPVLADGTRRTAINWTEINSKLPVIVLDHQPSNYREYFDTEADLILSGHTHKGQIFPGDLMTSWVYDYDYGLHTIAGNQKQILISSGIGTWGPPLRVMSDSELVIIQLH